MALDIRVWIWPKLRSVKRAIDALRDASRLEHQRAHLNAEDTRATADEYEDAQKDFTHELDWRTRPTMIDSSIKGNSAPTLQANPSITLSERTLSILAFGLAVAATVVSVMNAWDNKREVDFLRRHVEEYRIRTENAENTLVISGLYKPGDGVNGPSANPNRLKEK